MDQPDKPVILHIDDSADALALTRRWLESAGYAVVSADTALGAAQTLASMTPDLILLDALMPDTDGYEFCAKLQAENLTTAIPVVFLTALFTRQDKARAFAAGAVDFLIKPVRKEKLIETVRKYLAAKTQWTNLNSKKLSSGDARGFMEFLLKERGLSPEQGASLGTVSPENLYAASAQLGIDEEIVAKNLARYLEYPYVAEVNAKDVTLGALPTAFCKARQVVPILEDGERAFVMSNPLAWRLLDDLASLFGSVQKLRIAITQPRNILVLFADAPATVAATKTPSGEHAAPGSQPQGLPATMLEIEAKLSGIYQVEEETLEVSEEAEESAPIILLVNRIVDDAITAGASDIHIEPWEKDVVVRYRIDGDLRQVRKFHPQKLHLPVVARIKIMGNMSITERRLPQDGRIVYKEGIDLRVATIPTNFGEKVVLRLLDKRKSALPLESLGFSARNLSVYREKIQTPYGMILHVGPTGSGKSMTLFAALNEIKTPEINIQTIEDPIEYTLEGVCQTQVNNAVGLNFARGLRSFLRLDPDVILVGEIRDRETADVAVEAALTGHLMLSTLHTNDSAATVTRLIEMGIEPYLVSSSIVMICAQRLLRRLCLACRKESAASPAEKRLAGAPHAGELNLFAAVGCPACGGTGYKGRIGVHEILTMNDAMRTAMTSHAVNADELKRLAVETGGMTTLYWDAMEKARDGITSLKEVVAQVRADELTSRPLANPVPPLTKE